MFGQLTPDTGFKIWLECSQLSDPRRKWTTKQILKNGWLPNIKYLGVTRRYPKKYQPGISTPKNGFARRRSSKIIWVPWSCWRARRVPEFFPMVKMAIQLSFGHKFANWMHCWITNFIVCYNCIFETCWIHFWGCCPWGYLVICLVQGNRP